MVEQKREKFVDHPVVHTAGSQQRALQHDLGPAPDERLDLLDRERPASDSGERVVHRFGQIAAGVEQGAVKVEANQIERNRCHGGAHARCAVAMASQTWQRGDETND